jgi:ATP-dependent exoDNAse (exonuclease V) beta subunit
VALTFSRAAAGEIFNKIAERLAKAASSDALALEESGYIFQDLDRRAGAGSTHGVWSLDFPCDLCQASCAN